jgi:hypothetical protein
MIILNLFSYKRSQVPFFGLRRASRVQACPGLRLVAYASESASGCRYEIIFTFYELGSPSAYLARPGLGQGLKDYSRAFFENMYLSRKHGSRKTRKCSQLLFVYPRLIFLGFQKNLYLTFTPISSINQTYPKNIVSIKFDARFEFIFVYATISRLAAGSASHLSSY